jgi:EamA domain-containing membrane protein RarD
MSNTVKVTLLPQQENLGIAMEFFIIMFLMLKGEVYFMEKNDWQLEIKYRERKSVRFSTRMLWWIILAQELLFSCEVRHVVNLGLGYFIENLIEVV